MASGNELNKWDGAVFIALGSSLPGGYASSQALLEASIEALEGAGVTIRRRSGWWGSQAWPDPGEPPYVNGVAEVETDLRPADLLAVLHGVERAFGRERHDPNAPRTLDLDLIAHGRVVSDHPALPHPRAHDRRFVMGPLAQIAPDWRHPVSGLTARELVESAVVGRDAEPITD